MKRCALLWPLVMTLAACHAPPPQSRPPAAPAGELPVAFYRQAAKSAPVYVVNPAASRLEALVRRGGSLARLGHDHVVAARQFEGYASLGGGDADAWVADLRIDLESLSVDDARARQRHALDTTPSEDDIRRTRENMHGKVLHTSQWPDMRIHVEAGVATADPLEVSATLTLHGHSRTIALPVRLAVTAERVIARGSLDLSQSEFGIEPFSILGGSLAVQDELRLEFELAFDRWQPAAD